jgi:hypothetical protein
MRHTQIAAKESYHIRTFPAEAASASLPPALPAAPEPFRSATAIPDVPITVGRLMVAVYFTMIVVLAIGLGGDRDIDFALTVVGLFFIAYFAVPRILLGIAPKAGAQPSLDRFMRDGMMTYTGHTGGKAALVQILIVPVCLLIAMVGTMIIVHIVQ